MIKKRRREVLPQIGVFSELRMVEAQQMPRRMIAPERSFKVRQTERETYAGVNGPE